jgi:hypothetical protein
MKKEAVISSDQNYRYCLTRIWDESLSKLLIIGLNPSTADATLDDPTIRRCVNFARTWGFGSLYMANLFALRSTDPKALYKSEDAVGPENNSYLINLYNSTDQTLVAWGNHGSFLNRNELVLNLLGDVYCLGITKSNQPKHPLYIASHQERLKYSK